jgi:D-arabinose 1-dehydrogenase-like Zn-dependent alcohol dehydrogenase
MAYAAYEAPLEQIELPEPELVPGTALLEVLTCGICFSDVKTWLGQMPFSADLPLPHVPGHEVVARVVAADPPGALRAGTNVVVYHLSPCRVCARCRAGEENLCRQPAGWMGFTHPGGLRERMVVSLDRLTVVPEGIDAVHAAPMTCALGTAYRATVTRGGVAAGSRVGVIGLGGVGIHALQIARACGAEAIGFDVSPRALEAARALGLEAHAVDGGGHPAAGELDVVIDAVGQEATMQHAEQLVRAGGRIVAVGYAATSNFVVPSRRFVLEEVELVGSRYVQRAELERAIRLVADGRVQIVVDAVKPFAEAGEALTALREGGIVGRLVVDVAGVTRARS